MAEINNNPDFIAEAVYYHELTLEMLGKVLSIQEIALRTDPKSRESMKELVRVGGVRVSALRNATETTQFFLTGRSPNTDIPLMQMSGEGS